MIDFWRMVYEQDCHTIVSLTGETVEVGVVVIYCHTIVFLTGETVEVGVVLYTLTPSCP